jgi:hypothetical protein
MAKRPQQRLKFKVPWLFEAEGEGAAPIFIVAIISVLFLALTYGIAHYGVDRVSVLGNIDLRP